MAEFQVSESENLKFALHCFEILGGGTFSTFVRDAGVLFSVPLRFCDMRLISPACVALLLCLSLSGLGAEPYAVQVVDEVTGRGVPMVTLETVHGLRLVTDSAGWAAFDEPGLMRQRVYFTVSSPGYAFPRDESGVTGVALDTKPGGATELRLLRLNIAERLYRITGQGIYRDSTQLGKEAPLPSPNLSGGVLAQSDTQVALHNGRLHWTWGQTLLAAHPLRAVAGTQATSELPTTTGLDPTQGIHFQHVTGSDGALLRLLADPEPGEVGLDGLLSVKDAEGGAHLIAHYTRTKLDGKRLDHGLAELGAEGQFERLVVLGDDYLWQFPQGQAVQVAEGEREFFYFATPFAHVRVPAVYEAMLTPSHYEALAWDEEAGEVRWQKLKPPMTQQDEKRWIDKRMIKRGEARCQLRSRAGGEAVVEPTSGSVHWNTHRKAWLLICGTATGDVYCAQAAGVDGPWQKAVLVAGHTGHRFTAVTQLPAFDQEGGKIIYFQGTLEAADLKTPRYDGNALMYRLDLGDARLTR